MAYFANGSEGEVLENQCGHCLLFKHDDEHGTGCPIYQIQQIFNYDQLSVPKLEEAMSMLIDNDGACYYIHKYWRLIGDDEFKAYMEKKGGE